MDATLTFPSVEATLGAPSSISSSSHRSSYRSLIDAGQDLENGLNALLHTSPELQSAVRRRAGALLFMAQDNGFTPPELTQFFHRACRRGEFLMVPEAWPAIVGRGEHQLVISLPNQLVAKIETTGTQSRHSTMTPGFLPVAEKGYRCIQETWTTLERAFSPIVKALTREPAAARLLPEVATLCLSCSLQSDSISVRVSEAPAHGAPDESANLNVCVTRDLRADGSVVHEFNRRLLDKLPADNARELRTLHRELLRCMIGMWNAQRTALSGRSADGPYLDYIPHRTRRSPLETMSSIFFLLVKDGRGELVVGDLDHLRASESVRLGV